MLFTSFLTLSQATEKLAFRIIEALVAFYPYSSLAPYAPTIWQLLMTKLRDQRNPGYSRLFFHAFSIFIIHYGTTVMYDLLESISAGVVANLIQQVWAPQAASIAAGDDIEIKETLIGGTKLLCESPISQSSEIFGHLLKALVYLANARGVHNNVGVISIGDDVDERGLDTAYSKLAYCQLPDIDHDKNVHQASFYFVSSLSLLCQRNPGRYTSIISSALDSNESAVLAAAVKSAGLSII